MIEARGIHPSHPGVLQIRVYVARHDDAHRGGVRTLANIPCTYEEAPAVFAAWREANGDWARAGYNSPIHAVFNLGCTEIN